MIILPQRAARFARLVPVVLLPLLAACAGSGGVRSAASGGPVTVGIVAFNDFHGSLEPPRAAVTAPDGKGGTVAVPAGGAAWLASAVDSVRARHPYHLTVSAGDLISASQLSSSIYLDEPTVGVANRIGLDFNAVGNHEFDRGRDERGAASRARIDPISSHTPWVRAASCAYSMPGCVAIGPSVMAAVPSRRM